MLTYMAEQLEPYKDDLQLFWDTLEGETDVMDLVGKTLKEISEAEAGMIACQEVAKQYQDLQKHKKIFSLH